MEETNSLARSRRMGEMPEGKLLLSMAVPMMLSMLVQASNGSVYAGEFTL